MRVLAVISILILNTLEASAQSFTIYNYSVPEGLPSSEVYEVYQDRKGFLWFATDNGVAKYDGYSMKILHTKDGLTDPVVFSFFEDYKDRLWFRTFSGKLCYIENDSIKKYKYNDKLSAYNYMGIFNYVVTGNDEVFFAVQEFLGRVDSLGNLVVKKEKLIGTFLRTVGSEYLLGTSSYFFPARTLIIDGQEFPVSIKKTAYLNRVTRAVSWKNKIYIGLNYEVFEYDGKKLTKKLTSGYPVISLAVDKEDNLWVGYLNGGTVRFSDTDFKKSWRPEFLAHKSVTKVCQDHEGGLWFSTLENGVFHVPNLVIEHFALPSPSRIKGVIPFGKGVLLADQGGNFFYINSETKKVHRIRSWGVPLLSLYSDGKEIWLSTNWQTHIYRKDFSLKKEFSQVIARDFYRDKYGNTWTYGGNRLRKFDKNENLVSTHLLSIPYRFLHVEDSLIFLADRTGLDVRNKKLEVVNTDPQFSDIKISNILKLNDTTLAIPTIGKGLILMDQRYLTTKVFNSKSNFIADHIYSSLLTDSSLWLGTEKGLVKVNTRKLGQLKPSFEYLTKKSGLVSDKIDYLVEANNSIWAFSNNLFSIIPNGFSKFANSSPLFYIQELSVNNKVIPVNHSLNLSHEQNNIGIAFSLVSFNNPNILLRYRLSKEDAWIYTVSKNLIFNSLAPGHYSFELEYSADNLQWVPATLPLSIRINKPWWGKWYVILLAFCTLVVLGYWYFLHQQSIYRQRHHYLKIINDHQQKLIQSEIVALERERNRISKELHDRVGTNLTAIKLIVSQLLKTYGEPVAQEVEEQFQIALNEIKEIIYGLTPPSLERYGLFTGLRNYIGKLNKSIPITISLKVFGKDINKHDLNIIIFRIIQELLTNSIKHSFAKNITIHINSFDDILNIVYEDDGVGFSYDPLQSGLGLDNIESRIQSVNGSLKFDSGKFGISYTIDIPITLNKEVA